MKLIICVLALIAFIGQGAAFAHEGHNNITSETAIGIASKSVQQLTFKDFGYEVGKLDASWKSLSEANFAVIEVTSQMFVVSATNASSNEVIYFEITKNGEVIGVKGAK